MSEVSVFEFLSYIPLGFAAIFTPKVFSWLLLGIVIGFFVGLLPGLGGPAALALIIPFTFPMDPISAFALLLGLISVAMTAGDMTAILFGIPGVPESAATLVEGHALAKRGQAGRALGASLSASLVGAIFGAVCLAIAVVIMRPLVLSIGYAEFFMLSLAGITFLASLSSSAVLKGLSVGAFGIVLSMIGLDPVTAVERYTFGSLFLWDGIGFIPVILGLFAIPELIDMAEGRTRLDSATGAKISNAIEGVKDTFRNFWLVVRCSAISTYIGIIPGMGASIAQWVAYGHSVQTAREKNQIGKGAVEGIIGPGAANNATLSGGLVPTIGFGVPGTPQNAILLGAFIIHGLVPGPDMLRPESAGGNLTLTFAMVAMIITSNVIVVCSSFMFLNHIAKVAYLRAHLLIPFIVVLLFVGSFASKLSMNDLVVVLIFGFIGWGMERLDWPRPPLILGLVLGALIENNLFLSIASDGYQWTTRPSVLLILLLILAGLAYPFFKRRRETRRTAKSSTASNSSRVKQVVHGWSELGNLGVSCGVAAVFVFAVIESWNWPFQSRLIPTAVSTVGLCFVLPQMAVHMKRFISSGKVQTAYWSQIISGLRGSGARAGGFVWLVLFLSLGLIHVLGFILAIPVFLFVYLKVCARVRILWTILTSIVVGGGFYTLFIETVQMPIPKGIIVNLLIQEFPGLTDMLHWTGV